MDIEETETTPEELESPPDESENNPDQDPRDHLHIEWAGYI